MLHFVNYCDSPFGEKGTKCYVLPESPYVCMCYYPLQQSEVDITALHVITVLHACCVCVCVCTILVLSEEGERCCTFSSLVLRLVLGSWECSGRFSLLVVGAWTVGHSLLSTAVGAAQRCCGGSRLIYCPVSDYICSIR